MKKTSVLLVDDHSVVRMGLAAIINIEKDLKVCGEAESGVGQRVDDAAAGSTRLNHARTISNGIAFLPSSGFFQLENKFRLLYQKSRNAVNVPGSGC